MYIKILLYVLTYLDWLLFKLQHFCSKLLKYNFFSGSVNDILDELNREDEMRDSRCLDDADENEESGDNEQNSDHSFNDKMQDQTSKKRKTLN